MSSSRIDVSIEHRGGAPDSSGKKHPNTCPQCESHYRDDELDANLWVCPHCGHHFQMKARARIGSLADEGTFVEEATDVRSEDPLGIINDALVGLQRTQAQVLIEPDRERAIELALDRAQRGDIVLLAGKGHETTQVMKDRTLPLDDREVARRVLRQQGYGSS